MYTQLTSGQAGNRPLLSTLAWHAGSRTAACRGMLLIRASLNGDFSSLAKRNAVGESQERKKASCISNKLVKMFGNSRSVVLRVDMILIQDIRTGDGGIETTVW